MNELSLFSGAGGGLLGTKLLGWRAVGYVERDAYCQAVLQARIRDGLLDPAPIFGDIRAFLRDGHAELYRGVADVVTAGFPCQPFSVAGKRAGADDERNMWPETAECLRVVRPRFALLENVPGLVTSGYFGTVLGDLAALGFDAEWTVLGADDAGAPHLRKRLWILAYARNERSPRTGREPQPESTVVKSGNRNSEDVAHRERDGLEKRGVRRGLRAAAGGGDEGQAAVVGCPVADSLRRTPPLEPRRIGPERPEGVEPGREGAADAGLDGGAESVADASQFAEREPDNQAGAESWRQSRENTRWRSDGSEWWLHDPADEGAESLPGLGLLANGLARGLDEPRALAEAFVPRVAAGVPNRVHQLRALGNGQVPAVVVRAWHELTERAGLTR